LRAGVREFARIGAQPFTDGIPPDVAGDVFDGISRPKNVVVETLFPKRAAARFSKVEGGALFEQADELEQVAMGLGTFGEEVKVIRQQAEGMQSEGMAGRAFQ